MSKRLFALIALSLLAIFVVVKLSRSQPAQPTVTLTAPPAAVGEINTGDLEELVNQVRVQNGLGRLSDNRLLDDSAMARAEFLCDHNTFNHDGWADSLTYSYSKAGENLEYGETYQTPRTIVNQWVKSPAHYANILTPAYTEQGMGIKFCTQYQGEPNQIIIVNHFGAPK